MVGTPHDQTPQDQTPQEQPTQEQPIQEQTLATEAVVAELLQKMRRKEGNWLEWASACQTLQKSGWNPQRIFEETGFEPIQQNQILGAAQVYASIVTAGLPEPVRLHFQHRASDVLYEFRILSPQERSAAADCAFSRSMDMLEARELAKAMKDYSRLPKAPANFSNHPGDVMAYFAWQAAKQKPDLQSRSSFIAKGLKFAHTDVARKQVEQLLTDFTTAPTKRAPRLPIYRIESDEELPRVIPVVGQLPLKAVDLQAVPLVEPEEPFGLVPVSGASAWVAIPGWNVIQTAIDPVVLLAANSLLPTPIQGANNEVVLVIVDRSQQSWDEDSYFIIADSNEQLVICWLETPTAQALLGRVILVMRAKKVFDENYTKELYQWDE
jgi:hypothetical protein